MGGHRGYIVSAPSWAGRVAGAEEGKLRKLGSKVCQDPVLFEENATDRGLINNDPFNAMAFICPRSVP